MQFLLDRGIASRRGIMNAHREVPYRNQARPPHLPESERAQDRNIIVPLFCQLTDEEQDYICDALREACRK
jgi:dTDP-4-amino-4,6-dideoxygalactose transaminase